MANTLLFDDATYFRLRGWIPFPLYIATLAAIDLSPPAGWELGVGLSVIAAGVASRCAARVIIGRSSDTRRLHAKKLVTSGIYGWTRNPLYLGNWAIATGLAVLGGGAIPAILLGLALVLHYWRVVVAEENLLTAEFPVDYAHYVATVPRFFPWPPEHIRNGLGELRRERRIVVGVGVGTLALLALRLY